MTDMEEIPEFLRRKKGEASLPEIKTPKAEPELPKELPGDEPELENDTNKYDKIQRGMRETASELITEINEHYDAFLLNGTEFNAYELFRVKEVKPAIAKLVIDKFGPTLSELCATLHDAELRQAYRNIDVKQSVKFFDGLISDADRWIDNQKSAKGPRKTRTVRINPEKKIKNLKWQKEDRELKLLSIPPEKIIGAQELWTYNTRYKHLTHYVARGRTGFSIKGTTLQDFDVDNSMAKVLRKPEEVLTKVLEKKKKILEGLTTKPIEPTGRINENTILLRVG
jgi:hypothetical protein